MKSKTKILLSAASILAAVSLQGVNLEVQRFADGEPAPAGYQDVTDGIDAAGVINVSADPFVDYLVPNNSGSAGITAMKADGAYITESNAASLTGANNGTDPDAYQVVFAWSDGDPIPTGEDFFGVTWGGWSADNTATLTTRVDLASPDELTIYHWFNDGWNYADGGHSVLSGHVLTITQYAADGTEIASETTTLTSGGAESFFGDHRQFYSAIIKATRTAEGDYLIITNEGANIGYKGTAVALLGAGDMGPGEFSDYPVTDGWVDTGSFMGWVYIGDYPWVYNLSLDKYLFSGGSQWYYLQK